MLRENKNRQVIRSRTGRKFLVIGKQAKLLANVVVVLRGCPAIIPLYFTKLYRCTLPPQIGHHRIQPLQTLFAIPYASNLVSPKSAIEVVASAVRRNGDREHH